MQFIVYNLKLYKNFSLYPTSNTKKIIIFTSEATTSNDISYIYYQYECQVKNLLFCKYQDQTTKQSSCFYSSLLQFLKKT